MKKHYLAGAVIGAISYFIILLVTKTEIFNSIETRLIDYRYKFRPSHKVNPNIVIAGIDDSSIQIIGRWPWSRRIHASFLESFNQFPPKVIGFDVLFTEPDKTDPEGDNALVHFTKLLGNVVYAGYFDTSSPCAQGLDTSNNKTVFPIDELKNVSSTGLINASPDADGIIRKIPLVIKADGKILPSFTLEVLCKYLDLHFEDLKIVFGRCISIPQLCDVSSPCVQGLDVPIDENGCMWINYAGDQRVFKEIAYHQVLNWPKMEDFANKLILVGLTATALGDIGNLPIAVNTPLIVVHANVINTILNKDFINKVSPTVHIFILLLCVALSTVINIFFRPFKAGILSLIMVLIYGVTSLWLFQKNIWINLLGPSTGFILPFLLITVYRYGWEERERRWIKKVFTHYLSKDVIDIVLKEPDRLKLGGELKIATVLYADLRNFSSFCENRSPHEVVGMLNQCFDWMTEIVLKNGGMLDKYIGDAIMAIFGAPVSIPVAEQAEKAVLTAIEIVNKWRNLPEGIKSFVDIGIGINTGQMLIGNMGSRYIFNYTAVGDEVNIAARIQGLTGDYKVNIIITESVYKIIGDKFKTEFLGKALVKGRKETVAVYCVEV